MDRKLVQRTKITRNVRNYSLGDGRASTQYRGRWNVLFMRLQGEFGSCSWQRTEERGASVEYITK